METDGLVKFVAALKRSALAHADTSIQMLATETNTLKVGLVNVWFCWLSTLMDSNRNSQFLGTVEMLPLHQDHDTGNKKVLGLSQGQELDHRCRTTDRSRARRRDAKNKVVARVCKPESLLRSKSPAVKASSRQKI
jgi:hypothetical protein